MMCHLLIYDFSSALDIDSLKDNPRLNEILEAWRAPWERAQRAALPVGGERSNVVRGVFLFNSLRTEFSVYLCLFWFSITILCRFQNISPFVE